MKRRLLLVSVYVVIAAGCASSGGLTVVNLETEGGRRAFGFLVNGRSTRAEIRSRLGDPGRLFEAGRIVTYHLNEVSIVVEAQRRQWARYELVLVFDERDVLVRHSLIQRY